MTISNQGNIITITDVVTSDKIWLHVLLYKDSTLYSYNITPDISTFTLNNDGWFTIYSYLLDEYTDINSGLGYYIYNDGTNRYLYNNLDVCEVPDIYNDIKNTIVDNDLKNVFILCDLEKCLEILNTSILNQYNNGEPCKKIDTQQSDIAYMIYSTLKYMAKRGHFAEAQRLLDKSNRCGYLCETVSQSLSCNCN